MVLISEQENRAKRKKNIRHVGYLFFFIKLFVTNFVGQMDVKLKSVNRAVYYGNSTSNLSSFAFLLSLFYAVMAKAKVDKRTAKNPTNNEAI